MKALIGVELLRKLPKGPVEIRDTKLTGFVLRVRASGTHTYFANYGRGKWKPLGTTQVLTPPEAREAARLVLGDAMQGGDPIGEAKAAAATAAKQITFETFIRDHYEPWALAKRKADDPVRAKQRAQYVAEQVAQLHAFGFDQFRLHEITGFAVERWRSERLKTVTSETVNRHLNVLRGALSRAMDWDLLTVHPLARLKACKTDRTGIVRYLSTDEETRLLAALAARDERRRAERESANTWRRDRGYATWPAYETYTDHLTPLVTLALHTGLRRGELFQLCWRDVDLIGARVKVRGQITKNKQTRHVPLNSVALAVLRTWRPVGAIAGTYVFPGREEGQPLDDIKKGWAAVVELAALVDFRFHDCRHHFASQLVMRGVDLNTVRELLGHSDIKMVLRYAHLGPEHTAAAVARLVAS